MFRFPLLSALAILTVLLAGGPALAADAEAKEAASSKISADDLGLTDDASISRDQVELLDFGFKTSKLLPLYPYVKNRSREIQSVFEAAMELGQMKRAFAYAGEVPNWRRGLCYALMAQKLAGDGKAEAARTLCELAIAHSDDPHQEWRPALVHAHVSQVHSMLGATDDAARHLGEAEDAAFEGVHAEAATIDEADWKASVEFAERMIRSDHFERVKAGLQVLAGVYGEVYADEQKRELVRKKIEESGGKVPGYIRFQIRFRMIEGALKHEDRAGARAMLAKMRESYDQMGRVWVEDQAPILSRMLKLQIEAGQPDEARRKLLEEIKDYNKKLDETLNFKRADAMRPVAEVFAALGDGEAAVEMYERVVELGTINPNLRFRVEDLVDTSLSMALHDVAFADSIRAKMTRIYSELESDR